MASSPGSGDGHNGEAPKPEEQPSIPFYQRVAGGAQADYEAQRRLADLRAQLSDEERMLFELQVRNKVKDPGTMTLLAAIGFLGVAGLPRFVMDDVGVGILYLLTVGACFIGTIIDIVKMKETVARYNQKVELAELAAFIASRPPRQS
jgi:TM2 domain-containing membrane protein YozV